VVFILCLFLLLSEDLSFSLGVLPASQNVTAKQHIMAHIIRKNLLLANTDQLKKILKANDRNSLILTKGYLVSEEIAKDDVALIKAFHTRQVEALITIFQRTNKDLYSEIVDDIYNIFKRNHPKALKILKYRPNRILLLIFSTILLRENFLVAEGDMSERELVASQKFSAMVDSNKKLSKLKEFLNENGKLDLAIRNGERFFTFKSSPRRANTQEERFEFAQKFRKKASIQGIEYHKAYDEILVGILVRLDVCFDSDSYAYDPYRVLAIAFKKNKITRILEIGCGSCGFLSVLSDIVKSSDGVIFGIDKALSPNNNPTVMKKLVANKNNIRLLQGNMIDLDTEIKFDLIISSGVMSLTGSYLSLPEKPHEKYRGGPIGRTNGYNMNGMFYAFFNVRELIEKSIEVLSDNPKSVIFSNSYESILMMYKDEVEERAKVLLWDDSRKCKFYPVYEAIWNKDERAKKMWNFVWKEGASLVVLTHKAGTLRPHIQADTLVTHKIDFLSKILMDFSFNGISTEDIFDEENMAVLKEDVLRNLIKLDTHGKVKYTIRYDEKKLFDYKNVIEKYSNVLRKIVGTKSVVKLVPFSSKQEKEKSLISIHAESSSFEGEGNVDIILPESEDVTNYLLRIVGMLNIAFAAAQIPSDLAEVEIKSRYGYIEGYIRNQYKSIIGEGLKIEEGKSLLFSLQNIVLRLPESYKIGEIRVKYNSILEKILQSA